ncbi:hypothetical protein C0J52_22694 [Blattella germanica]|nr:hypothetical protein C0J52_22694 [Blattella germanica]
MPYKNSNGRAAQTDQSAGQSEYSSPPPEEASATSSSAPPPPTINMGTVDQSASVPDQPLRRRLRPRPHR